MGDGRWLTNKREKTEETRWMHFFGSRLVLKDLGTELGVAGCYLHCWGREARCNRLSETSRKNSAETRAKTQKEQEQIILKFFIIINVYNWLQYLVDHSLSEASMRKTSTVPFNIVWSTIWMVKLLCSKCFLASNYCKTVSFSFIELLP